VTGEDCEVHDQEYCDPLQCRQGFHYEANSCVKNICKCLNGELAKKCEKHGGSSCEIGSCKKGFYMTEESKKSANPECTALFKGKDHTAVGSTGVYFLFELGYKYNLAQAHQICHDLGANLGTIRDHAELEIINSIVTDHCWVDVSSPKISDIRSDWIWGNNGGQVSTDDDFWYPDRPILDGLSGNTGGWIKDKGISNNVDGVHGVLCEIRTNQ